LPLQCEFASSSYWANTIFSFFTTCLPYQCSHRNQTFAARAGWYHHHWWVYISKADRNVNGGRVAMFVHKSLCVSMLSESDSFYLGKLEKPEYLFCEVRGFLWFRPVFVATVYTASCTVYLQVFVPQLVSHNYNHKIILGEIKSFNVNQLSCSDNDLYIKQLTTDNSLHLVQYRAIHHTHKASIWLDFCMIDESNKVLSSLKDD